MIKRQLENSNDIEEYISNIYRMVIENIEKLYFESNMSIREFALFVDVSHSTVKRILEHPARIELDTLCKIAACCNYPLVCMVSDISYEETQLLNKYRELSELQKEAIDLRIKKMECRRKNKAVNKTTDRIMPGQITIFDLM